MLQANFSVNTDPVTKLAVAFDKAAPKAGNQVRAVMAKTAFDVKKDWRESAIKSARKHGVHYPYTINYELRETFGAGGLHGFEAEVKPDVGALQGPLAYVLEHGTRNSPGHQDGAKALQKNVAPFVVHMQHALYSAASRITQTSIGS